jgi:hypothetical protein
MITREEAQQVLDALKWFEQRFACTHLELIDTIRAKLSAPEPEPVAWRKKWENEDKWEYYEFDRYRGSEPLYAVQPQREWRGLTRGDADSLRVSYTKDGVVQVDALLMRVDEMLRERNT